MKSKGRDKSMWKWLGMMLGVTPRNTTKPAYQRPYETEGEARIKARIKAERLKRLEVSAISDYKVYYRMHRQKIEEAIVRVKRTHAYHLRARA